MQPAEDVMKGINRIREITRETKSIRATIEEMRGESPKMDRPKIRKKLDEISDIIDELSPKVDLDELPELVRYKRRHSRKFLDSKLTAIGRLATHIHTRVLVLGR